MKKLLVMFTAIITAIIFGVSCFIVYSMGYSKGHNVGYVDGLNAGYKEVRENIENDVRDSVNCFGTYYGYDGIQINYDIKEVED
jgi:hypothetical protein|nr:MAG TPA: protein of unknown function (DUF5016) [Caudoviricetes sp.]